jgi:hypothetical protein
MEEIETEKIEAEEKDSVGYAPDYTFEVNNPTALSNWANNVTSGGQDYTSVVIRRGTWSITRSLSSDSDAAINLILTGTKRVIGDADSLIIVNLSNGQGSAIKGQVTNTYPNLVNPDDNSKDHSMTGVSIKVTAPAGQIVKIFTNCTNLTNCTAIGKGNGFDNCTNLINCTATRTHDNACSGFFHCIDLVNCISTANSSVSSAVGFSKCTNLINCKGNASVIGNSMGCGFYDCRNLTNCTGAGTGAIFFFKGRPRDNRVHRVRKLFPSTGPFPLRVFRIGKCLLCIHAFSLADYVSSEKQQK